MAINIQNKLILQLLVFRKPWFRLIKRLFSIPKYSK